MAYTAFGTGANETRKLWSPQVEKKMEQKAYFKQGRDISEEVGAAPFRRKTDLEKENEAGDRIRMTTVAPLVGDGVTGDGVMQGKGEAISTDTQDVLIDQLRHEVESGGRMSQKRVVLDFRKTGRDTLSQWHARNWDDLRILTLYGIIPNAAGSTGGTLKWSQAKLNSFLGAQIVAPDSGHQMFANNRANDGALSSTDVMSGKLISQAKKKALELDTPLTPIEVDGEELLVCYITTGQALALSYDSDWRNAQALAGKRDKSNPLFKGVEAEYDGVLIRVLPRSPRPAANVARAVLCGADDVFEAFGMPENAEASPISWNEEKWDRGARKVITVGAIGGMRKNTFKGAWLNSIAIDTYSDGVSC